VEKTIDLQRSLAERMTLVRAEANIRGLLDYWHLSDYAKHLEATGGVGVLRMVRERGLNHAGPLGFWPSDTRTTWHIRPPDGFLAAIGYGVASEAAARVEQAAALREKEAAQPTEH